MAGIEGYEGAIARILDASFVQILKPQEVDVVLVRTEIPDMVPPLRRHTLTVNGMLVRLDDRALAEPVGKLRRIVERERELRRWWSCDP